MRRIEPPYLEKEIVQRTEDFDSPNGNNATMADFMDSDEDQIRLGEEECAIDRYLQQPGNEDSILDESCTQVKKAAVKIPSWRVLWALLLTNGPRRMTKNQYQSLRTLADTCAQIEPSSWNQEHKLLSSQIQFSSLNVLPHYNTLHKSFKTAIFQALVPKAFNSEVSVDMKKAGARCSHISASSQATTLLRTVLPSEYARADVGSGPVFQAMCSTTLSSCKTHQQIPDAPGISASACIDIWPIISARQWFYGYPQMSSVDCPDASNSTSSNSTPPNFSASNSTPFCETDDIITVTLLGQDALPDTLARSFKASKNRAGYLQVQGSVLHIWTVHSNIRQDCPGFNCGDTKNLSDRDRDIVRHCSFIAYRSPTDCVNAELPEISLEQSEDNDQLDFGERSQPRARQRRKTSGRMAEAVKIRNAALRKQKLQVQNLWRSCKKPLLKPADVVTMLGPSNDLLSDNSTPRLFVVNRFWVENEERSRHAFFLLGGPLAFLQEGLNSGDATFLSSFSEKIGRNMYRYYRDVLSVHIAKPHPGHRCPQKYTPISSLGTLHSVEKYFIYRFVLFWDGFEISKGKSSSGEGFYMMCLNLPVKDRCSPSAVRIISLTPPGVKFEAVFHRIKADIVQGMTDGFLDIDANGETRRIFLDLVGFVGDTPAINAALDVLGHNATACCHACRFRRGSSTVVGSKYTSRNQYGSITSHGRGFYKHTAIHDSHAKAETCRLMGMKPLDSNSVLLLHDLRAAIVGCKEKIPTTNNGAPILAGDLDPYQSCFIAPDHLLSGHVRDCINLGFKLLPSRDHREACESFMIGLLRDCGLPAQNRLLNCEKKQLFTMSMSELFALALIAELGFLSGIRQVDFSEVSPSLVSKRCMSAIALVGSCSRLIAALWSLPDAEKDGVHAVMQFDDENGFTTLSRIQKLTTKHLLDLERQCSMDDADVAYMENAAGGRRSAIEKEHASCLISIRTIDKPNVHRRQELAFSTKPMLGHVSRCAELVLEKAHQTLKRAVRDSNNKDVHLSSMESAAFSDWQGRLTMIAKDALKGDEPALRGAFRLLAGRESILSIHGQLSAEHILQVRFALGPEHCVPVELENQALTVLSKRCSLGEDLVWKLNGDIEPVHRGTGLSTQRRQNTLNTIRQALKFDKTMYKIRMADEVTATQTNGLLGLRFRIGDVLEILCAHAHNINYHFPFLIQPTHLSPTSTSNESSCSLFWCVSTVFSITHSSGMSEFYASVLHCVPVLDGTPGTSSCSETRQMYRVNDRFDPPRQQNYSLVRLTEHIRKVGVLHVCEPGICLARPMQSEIEHIGRSSPLDGALFYVLSRKSGFPPRQG